MKHFYIVFFAFIVVSCNQNYKKSDLLGTWDVIYSTDLETGEIELPENDETIFVEIRLDSIYLSWDETYSWKIKGDSILIKEFATIYIKELTSNRLTVEYDFFSKQQITLNKRK